MLPWAELDPEQRRMIVEGEGKFPGIRGFFNHLERKKYKLHVRVFLSRYRGYSTCSACGGARLRIEAQQVKIDGKNICQVTSMTVEEVSKFFCRGQAHRAGVRHCRQAAAGDSRAAAIPD